MKRRRSREYALQILFQLELSGTELNEELWSEFWDGITEDDQVKDFTRIIVKSTLEHKHKLDESIKKATEHWEIDRMAVLDRNILRAAAYELLFRHDIPPQVAINEALEIAKKYSTKDSASFINGILDRIAHEVSGAGRQKENSH
jgi:N utilization substance protein B